MEWINEISLVRGYGEDITGQAWTIETSGLGVRAA